MKTLGLIGGITWLSTLDYYRLLNQLTNERLGGVSSARILMNSLEFAEIKRLTEADDWDELARIVGSAALALQDAGAEAILIGANTMHKIAPEVQDVLNIPVIHIAEETGKQIRLLNLKKVALLGTRYTMQLDFYRDKLAEQDIESIIPDAAEDIDFINGAIYNEMGKGLFLPATKKRILQIIDQLAGRGAEGIILGCTELPILIKPEDCDPPLFDTTLIHARAGVAFALGD